MVKALFVNGSPRKKWNTAQLLEAAMEGAAAEGAECGLAHLYDHAAKGCTSCFACKLKDAKTGGLCAMRDELTPVLQKANEADVIVVGTPVYFDYPTANAKAFLERLMFPWSAYKYDARTGKAGTSLLTRTIPTGLIYTMNTPEDWLDRRSYHTILDVTEGYMRTTFGHCESLYSCDTLQFSDYSRYDVDTFKEEDKLAHRSEQFPRDLAAAREMGARLVRLASSAY